MTLYEVEVFVDHDSVGIYLVRCNGENEALEIALEHVRDLTGGEVKEVNFRTRSMSSTTTGYWKGESDHE